MAIDWDSVRAMALDCLNSALDLQRWAERSQQKDYDVDCATQHLATILKARDTFDRSLAILPSGYVAQASDPPRQFPIFDELAKASAHVSDRPDFGISATAHEAAFRLLLIVLLHIENNLKGELTFENLHNVSPRQRRDALYTSEKQDSIRNVLDFNLLYKIEAEIHREWAAVSAIPPTTRAIGGKTLGQENHYLEITVGDRKALRIVDGKALIACFGRKVKPWEMFRELYHSGHAGLQRSEIMALLWPNGVVSDNNLDQHKATANEILVTIRVEISPDNRGVWRLKELNS
jgi:hypothetical protein